MRGKDTRLVPAALLAWGSVAWAVTSSERAVLVVAMVAVVLAACLVRWPTVAMPLLVLATVCAGAGARLLIIEADPLVRWAEDHRHVTAEVQIRQDARSFSRGEHRGAVVPILVRRAHSSAGTVATRARATAFVQDDAAPLVVGRRLIIQGRLAPSDASDEVAVVRVSSLTLAGSGPWWWEASERVRAGIRDAVAGRQHVGAALVPALVAGDVSAVDDRLREDFQRAGLTHLTAVSGSNLTIVLGAALLLARPLRRGALVLPVALVVIVVFVLVARPEPSVQRAAIMGVVAVVAMGRGTRDGLRALSWAVLVVLLLDPWMGRQAGFVLSVCATSGIVLMGPVLTERLQSWLPRWIAMAVAVPLSAHLACVPAVAAISQEVSLVAVLANLAAAPAVAPATVLGLLGGLTTLVVEPLGQLMGSLAVVAAGWIVTTARYTSALDGAAVPWRQGWWLLALLTPVIVLALLAVARRPLLSIGLVLGLLVVVVRPPQSGWPPQAAVLVSCDVGQGDASVVPLTAGEAIVVDVGQEPGPIDRCLRRLGITRIRLLVFSHADADHVAGWRGAVRGRQVDQVMVGPSGGPEVPGARRSSAVAGQLDTVGDVRIETLWPPQQTSTAQPRNDVSIVQRMTIHGVRVLFTGDLGEEAQRRVLRTGEVDAEVLKVAHHGSADQSADFIAATGARVATVSAGADNSYGHPTAAALSLLRAHGIHWWRTDLHGDIAIVREGGALRAVAR